MAGRRAAPPPSMATARATGTRACRCRRERTAGRCSRATPGAPWGRSWRRSAWRSGICSRSTPEARSSPATPIRPRTGRSCSRSCGSSPRGSSRRPDGKGGWINNIRNCRKVLFHLPRLLADPRKPVYMVEGEKDVLALEELGLVATTNPGGAGKWRPETSLSGRTWLGGSCPTRWRRSSGRPRRCGGSDWGRKRAPGTPSGMNNLPGRAPREQKPSRTGVRTPEKRHRFVRFLLSRRPLAGRAYPVTYDDVKSKGNDPSPAGAAGGEKPPEICRSNAALSP